MTTTYVQEGKTITLTAAQSYTKDRVYLLGDDQVPGVALDDYASGDEATFAVEGVRDLAVASGATATNQGDPAYWDATANEATDDGDGNARIGVFWQNEDVKLNEPGAVGGRMDFIAIDDTDSPYDLTMLRDTFLSVDTQSNPATVNLPPAADVKGLRLVIKRAGTGVNAVTIEGDGAETIDGSANNTDLDAQYDSIELVSDGTEYHVVGSTIA